MSKHAKILQNISKVAFSNIATVIAGVVVGFIIPKILTVDEYGYYKTFTLYTTYTGLFSIGIIDGIVLDYGGYDYSDYNRPFFRSIFKWYILIHFFWVLVLAGFSLIVKNSNYSFIFLMIAIYMFFSNIVGYFQQISQITQRFSEFSTAKIVQSVMKIIGGLIMVALYRYASEYANYKTYTGLTVFGFVIIAAGYIFIYREIIFGKIQRLAETKQNISHFIKIGIPLMIANLCSTLLLTLDRQFVNILFENSQYAIYAFAYNLLALVTVATTAISTVLYPIMKRTAPDSLKTNYSDLIGTILIFVYGALAIYFPLCTFINWFLPKYSSSLEVFRVIFPGLAISSAVTVVMHNYYKTVGENNLFFKKSLVTLLFSFFANLLAFVIFKTAISISISSIITMVLWYLYVEQYFVEQYGYNRFQNLLYLLIMMIIFYLVTIINNNLLSAFIYILLFVCITFIMQKGLLKKAKIVFTNKI